MKGGAHFGATLPTRRFFQSIDTYQAYGSKNPLHYHINQTHGSIPFRSQLSPTLMSQEILKALEIA